MHAPSWALIALCTGTLCLAACDKTPPISATPKVEPALPSQSGVTAGSPGDPSVPSAASALPSGNAASAQPMQGRSNNAMTATQESTAMPLPGQNNDHSAPLIPPKRASAP